MVQTSLPAIVLGADHAAFHLKERISAHLRAKGYSVEDIGCYSEASVDYPEISQKVAQEMHSSTDPNVRGVICCGSGIGVAISANRFPWVRAAVAHDHFAATMSRRHNNANVVCFGARVIAPELALELLDAWLATEFEGERHQKRVSMMADLDFNIENQTRGVSAC